MAVRKNRIIFTAFAAAVVLLTFYGAKHATISRKAYAQVKAAPFVVELQTYNFEQNPTGTLVNRKIIVRRSDGATATVSTVGPLERGATARKVVFPDGRYTGIVDFVASKISGSLKPTALAFLKNRLENPPPNCAFPSYEFLGYEELLAVSVARLERFDTKGRTTRWMAPQLGCEPLRYKFESKQPDGSFKLVSLEEAVTLKLGEPDPSLFDVASNYPDVTLPELERRFAQALGAPR